MTTRNPPSAGTSGTLPAPSQPREALDAAIEAARLASPVVEGPHGQRHIFVPDGFDLHHANDPHALPPHIVQAVTVDDAESLVRYTNRFSDVRSVLIADLDEMAIRSVLDWHRNNSHEGEMAPEPCRHSATLALRESEEFRRWNAIQGELHDQMVFAEFLDENASDIVDPEPSVMLEVARDLEATQGVNFKASTRLQTGERNLSYETQTHVKGDLKVPMQFTLAIPLFEGEEPADIVASFRFRPRSDGLKLGFVWRRVEYRRRAEFRQIAHRVAEATGRPLFFGRAL